MIAKNARRTDLLQVLNTYRSQILADVKNRMQQRRAEGPIDGRDGLEHADSDAQGEIEVVLLQAKSDTLARVDEALARLEAGTYGSCLECDGDIAESRLRALPFAVRCHTCEQDRELAQRNARDGAWHRVLSTVDNVSS